MKACSFVLVALVNSGECARCYVPRVCQVLLPPVGSGSPGSTQAASVEMAGYRQASPDCTESAILQLQVALDLIQHGDELGDQFLARRPELHASVLG
mmetsp:Transcript_35174/g.63907  ORF Transcript_35174/g.63907 Transcript_35174/m.63907 type:complete len:97 (+) Transcript_35174:172-462(+)